MVITNLQEKENRKIWVPIRGGNRGGWSLFDWEKVREMPYRDREMYLGNSAKIGVLDKGGKWRKKDWYLHRNGFEKGDELNQKMMAAIRKDQERMNTALGIEQADDQEDKLTPAELSILLKKVRGNKEDFEKEDDHTIGLGFDKMKVQIRAKPNARAVDNPHKLEGNEPIESYHKQRKKQQPKKKEQQYRRKSRSNSEKRKKKHKKEKKQRKEKQDRYERSRSRQHKRKDRSQSRSVQKEKKHKQRKHRHRSQSN